MNLSIPCKHKKHNLKTKPNPKTACNPLGAGAPVQYTAEFIEGEADAFEEWMELPDSIFFKRFALKRGYHPQRLAEFAEKNERFAEVNAKAHAWQECRVVEGGLRSEFNSSICKFVLANICKWVERHEAKISGDSDNPLQFILDKADGTTKDLIDETED